MNNEGIIKFDCKLIEGYNVEPGLVADIIECRSKLYQFKLIGEDSCGVGYGNISKRIGINANGKPQFIITGTQTSGKKDITHYDFSVVTDFNFEKNYIECYGASKASSESLSHAMLYILDERICSVIHFHSEVLWNKLKHIAPTTDESIEYGTTALALEFRRLYENNILQKSRIVVMGGHINGLIAFGSDVKSITEFIITTVNNNE